MLHSQTIPRTEITEEIICEMFQVFRENFDGATRNIFERDLNNKNWIILLRDTQNNELEGFSTLALYETVHQNKPVSVVYSGDTIIRRQYWGTPELPRTWIHTVLERSANLPQPLYWLLLSSGYKTYRFLTVFYKEFFPRYDKPTPSEMQALMDYLATQRFGLDYHAEQGIVRFTNGATPLRMGIADVTDERLHDAHIAFYTARNPGHANGDELVCIAQIHPDNFTPAGKRMAR